MSNFSPLASFIILRPISLSKLWASTKASDLPASSVTLIFTVSEVVIEWLTLPIVCSIACGLVVPIPTLPSLVTNTTGSTIEDVLAPNAYNAFVDEASEIFTNGYIPWILDCTLVDTTAVGISLYDPLVNL